MDTATWKARFSHPQHPWRDFTLSFARDTEYPPAAIRKPSLLAGAPAYDIYLLSDSLGWPNSCLYTYTESVIGNLEDDNPPEHSLDIPETPPYE